mgnify:CR=1 FL=1
MILSGCWRGEDFEGREARGSRDFDKSSAMTACSLSVALEKKRFSNPIVGSGMQQARKVST